MPGDLRIADLAASDYFTPDELDDADRYELFHRVNWLASTAVLLAVLGVYARQGSALHAGVRGGADRHRDVARDARLRARLARERPVSRRRQLVGPPPRRLEGRLRRARVRRLAGARRAVPLPLALGAHRHGIRAAGRRLVVDPGQPRLRRPGDALRLHLAVPDDRDGEDRGRTAGRRRPAPRADPGRRGHRGARGGRRPLYVCRQRLRDRDRAYAQGVPLEHAARRALRRRGGARGHRARVRPSLAGALCRRRSPGTRCSPSPAPGRSPASRGAGAGCAARRQCRCRSSPSPC